MAERLDPHALDPDVDILTNDVGTWFTHDHEHRDHEGAEPHTHRHDHRRRSKRGNHDHHLLQEQRDG